MRRAIVIAIIFFIAIVILKLTVLTGLSILYIIGIAATGVVYHILSRHLTDRNGEPTTWGKVAGWVVIIIVAGTFFWAMIPWQIKDAMVLREKKNIAETSKAILPNTIGDSTLQTERIKYAGILDSLFQDSVNTINKSGAPIGEQIRRKVAAKTYFDGLYSQLFGKPLPPPQTAESTYGRNAETYSVPVNGWTKMINVCPYRHFVISPTDTVRVRFNDESGFITYPHNGNRVAVSSSIFSLQAFHPGTTVTVEKWN